MMMLKKTIPPLALLLAITAIVLSLRNTNNKPVYIDTGRLYQEFQLSKELNAELETFIKRRKSYLDSIYRELKLRFVTQNQHPTNNPDSLALLSRMQQDYISQQEVIERENEEETVRCEKKIWTQVNTYLAEYGKDKGYLLVLGAKGDGTIMYADKGIEITEDVISYLNTRYNGKND